LLQLQQINQVYIANRSKQPVFATNSQSLQASNSKQLAKLTSKQQQATASNSKNEQYYDCQQQECLSHRSRC